MVVITTDRRDVILDAVRAMYTAVADRPEAEYHFPTGRRACEYVGYPAEQLNRLPAAALESFAGVGYPFSGGAIHEGEVVLDIGSGSGTDLLLAALLAGPAGRAIGLDMTEAMRRGQRTAGAGEIPVQGAEHLARRRALADADPGIPRGRTGGHVANGAVHAGWRRAARAARGEHGAQRRGGHTPRPGVLPGRRIRVQRRRARHDMRVGGAIGRKLFGLRPTVRSRRGRQQPRSARIMPEIHPALQYRAT
jgi:SAM-dependent methyltransferase